MRLSSRARLRLALGLDGWASGRSGWRLWGFCLQSCDLWGIFIYVPPFFVVGFRFWLKEFLPSYGREAFVSRKTRLAFFFSWNFMRWKGCCS